jgi:hypothetical protein
MLNSHYLSGLILKPISQWLNVQIISRCLSLQLIPCLEALHLNTAVPLGRGVILNTMVAVVFMKVIFHKRLEESEGVRHKET